jgi:hypothetical protein
MNTVTKSGPRFGVGLKLAIAFLVFLAAESSARAALEEAMTKFKAAIMRAAKPEGTPPQDNRAAQLTMLLGRLQADIDHQSWRDATAQLNYFGNEEKSPDMIQLIHELRLEILKQIEAGENAVLSRIEATLKDAGQICSLAKSPSELDDILHQLSVLRPGDGLQNERMQAAWQRVNGAIAFAHRWQDFLMKRLAGKDTDAAAVIQGLLDDGKLYPLVDRSILLARLEGLQGPSQVKPGEENPAEAIRRTQSLDELDELSATLEQLFSKKRDKAANTVLHQVASLRRAYIEYRTGLYGAAFEHCQFAQADSEARPELLSLRQQLLIRLLPHYLNIDPSFVDSTSDASKYLMQVMARAREKSDWRLALHALETLQLVAFRSGPPPPWLTADIAGYRSLVAAVNQEAGGLSSDALEGYKKALGSSGQDLPIDWIAGRIKFLRGVRVDLPKRGPTKR